LILDPRQSKLKGNSNISKWRELLKEELLKKRKFKSDLSGQELYECHMHEGILTRANVPSCIKWSWMIFHEYNSFLLLPNEHIPNPPSREWCIERSFSLYGKDNVLEWYYSLPFKSFPFRIG
jgi:hypothetical protein